MDEFQRHVMDELRTLKSRQNAILLLICILIVWLCGLSLGSDITIAVQDRQQFGQADFPYIYYMTVEHLPVERRDETLNVLKFAICSLNSRVVIEQQLPVPIDDTLVRIDTRALGWEHTFPEFLKEHYPYVVQRGALCLLIKADFFIQAAMDQTVSGGFYHRFIFGKELKTIDEFKQLLGVSPEADYRHGHIEARSGVSVQGVRLITAIPTSRRADFWITDDIEQIDRKRDPLEHLDLSHKPDAHEAIGALPKSVASTGALGSLQTYALANGAGVIQEKAPTNIVVDHTGIRGVEILNPVSCITCHQEGLRPIKTNALRQYIQSGADVFAKYETQVAIEQFHLTNIQTLLDRGNYDYSVILEAINGFTPKENAEAFAAVIRFYDAPLTLERAAQELLCTPEQLQHALAVYGNLPPRLAQLAHGIPIPRDAWEEVFPVAYEAMRRWRAK
jgi:hypothetical protein